MLLYNTIYEQNKKGKKSMITIYHCKTCNTNFMIPMIITNILEVSKIVCPNCKSHDWKRIAM
jgi:DNA-directed RNA polymerase subunit RPC12/RpoP